MRVKSFFSPSGWHTNLCKYSDYRRGGCPGGYFGTLNCCEVFGANLHSVTDGGVSGRRQ
jgi:hypothetical protein